MAEDRVRDAAVPEWVVTSILFFFWGVIGVLQAGEMCKQGRCHRPTGSKLSQGSQFRPGPGPGPGPGPDQDEQHTKSMAWHKLCRCVRSQSLRVTGQGHPPVGCFGGTLRLHSLKWRIRSKFTPLDSQMGEWVTHVDARMREWTTCSRRDSGKGQKQGA